MNKILIIDTPSRDSRMMATLMGKAGYFPITADSFEDGEKSIQSPRLELNGCRIT